MLEYENVHHAINANEKSLVTIEEKIIRLAKERNEIKQRLNYLYQQKRERITKVEA